MIRVDATRSLRICVTGIFEPGPGNIEIMMPGAITGD